MLSRIRNTVPNTSCERNSTMKIGARIVLLITYPKFRSSKQCLFSMESFQNTSASIPGEGYFLFRQPFQAIIINSKLNFQKTINNQSVCTGEGFLLSVLSSFVYFVVCSISIQFVSID
ncbi:hypothetical protein CEXT_645251 [Caerostris extrusa]|uniref:Uncharacterized protein n=1 Tax=Caerostris extrusa TaxID=172846 RepID=A0AAV4WQ28_CAEEX|nr:hypothetical protein CEXT_645251 [Caerostris extrusa]